MRDRNPGPGMVYDCTAGEWQEPMALERELAMGFMEDATAHQEVTEAARRKALGRAMDLNVMHWLALSGTRAAPPPVARRGDLGDPRGLPSRRPSRRPWGPARPPHQSPVVATTGAARGPLPSPVEATSGAVRGALPVARRGDFGGRARPSPSPVEATSGGPRGALPVARRGGSGGPSRWLWGPVAAPSLVPVAAPRGGPRGSLLVAPRGALGALRWERKRDKAAAIQPPTERSAAKEALARAMLGEMEDNEEVQQERGHPLERRWVYPWEEEDERPASTRSRLRSGSQESGRRRRWTKSVRISVGWRKP
ncbi:unnamed protein product [Closterium sp. Naga37s-1]|nr:unnamed protein product [Closterium sp. Naga37s-1]